MTDVSDTKLEYDDKIVSAELGTALRVRSYNPTTGPAEINLMDVTDLKRAPRWISVFGAGTVDVIGLDDVAVTLPSASSGHPHIGAFKKLLNTGSCTSITVNW